jgi:hypothetical protein
VKFTWPYMAQGLLRSKASLTQALRLTPEQSEYLINRLFDRCELDVVIRQDGRISLVARPKSPRGNKLKS